MLLLLLLLMMGFVTGWRLGTGMMVMMSQGFFLLFGRNDEQLPSLP